MKNRTFIYLVAFFSVINLLSPFCSIAQSIQKKEAIRESLNSYTTAHLQEKIYLHTDKDYYVAGEILWFKIYVVDGILNNPLNISKVGYVEILDDKNNAVLQAKVDLNESFGNGSFQLPIDLESKTYRIRAYTNWMKNFSAAFFFQKSILISSILNNENGINTSKNAQNDLSFFPEGGSLVNNLESTVAFKAIDKNGYGLNFKGYLLNQNKDTILRFEPLKYGMGRFKFKPSVLDTYTAEIVSNGETIVKKLPKIYEQGYVMELKALANDQIQIIVQAKVSDTENEIILVSHTRGIVKHILEEKIVNGSTQFIIDKKALNDGISHLTIFNNELKPLCERLYFNRPEIQQRVILSTNKETYQQRDKVSLALKVDSLEKHDNTYNLSLALFNSNSLDSTNNINIKNYLWLSSDLNGFIENPEYYFQQTDAEAADNLMLTQGWRRFKWDNVTSRNNQKIKYLPELNTHIITATVLDKSNNIPLANKQLYLSIPQNDNYFNEGISNVAGEVKFEAKKFYNLKEFVLQPDSYTDTSILVTVNSPFSTVFSNEFSPKTFHYNKINHFANSSLGMQIQKIYYADSINTFKENSTESIPFYGKPDKVYIINDYTKFDKVGDIIKEYVYEVSLRKENNTALFKVTTDEQNKVNFDNQALVLLDGIPVLDVNQILEYDPNSLKSIAIVRKNYFYGNLNFGGLVHFNTYKGTAPNFKHHLNTLIQDYEGLQQQREFYEPKYDTNVKLKNRLPDFRSTLYWNPNIKISQNETTLSFFTSDLEGDYILVLQGLSSDGKVVSETKRISVKK